MTIKKVDHGVHIYKTMQTNWQFEQSVINGNCSRLSGVSFEMCEESINRGALKIWELWGEVNEEIHNCYLEKRGNDTDYMTKR